MISLKMFVNTSLKYNQNDLNNRVHTLFNFIKIEIYFFFDEPSGCEINFNKKDVP